MKTQLILCCIALAMRSGYAQNVAINPTGVAPHPSAILDVSAENKGILIPRLPTSERQTILDPADGLLVYDTNTNSFWYFSNDIWHEISGGALSGPAGGDLGGTYPAPNVVKLQNLDVAHDIPFDKQVLKWDATANNWKGRNDSLFLPHIATASDPQRLLSITNTWNGFSYATAILGRRHAGSGISMSSSAGIWGDAASGTGLLGTSSTHPGVHGISLQYHGVFGKSDGGIGFAGVYGTREGTGLNPAGTIGVWGDNANGLGVLGSSNTGIGVYGLAQVNHGVYGYSTTADFAGVKGSHANDNGIGVMGEIGQLGLGVYGKGTGITSIAGRFENTAPDNTYMALDARNLGLGAAATFWTSNPDNPSPTLMVSSHSAGHGIFALHDSVGSDNSAIRAWHLGSGDGINAKSNEGDAGRLIIENWLSEGNALHASTLGTGSAGVFQKVHVLGESANEPAVLIDNYSRSTALKVKSLLSSSLESAIDVEFAGYGFAVDIATSHSGLRAMTSHPGGHAIFGNHDAQDGTAIHGNATAFGGVGVHGNANGNFGVGIKGTVSDALGIAIKGEANSIHGAVVGENSGNGGGVVGINLSGFGFGVVGDTGPLHGIGGQFRSSNSTSEISPAISALVSSKSNAVEILINNETNAKNALWVKHDGSGNLALFRNQAEDQIIFANNGNITTKGNIAANGSVTVKNNKGIIRNSSSAQKRMETRDVDLIHFNMPVGAMVTATVTFSQTFSAPPLVTLGQINSGYTGPCEKMTVQIKNVTNTGCTVTMYNPGVSGNPDVSGTWNLLVIGNE